MRNKRTVTLPKALSSELAAQEGGGGRGSRHGAKKQMSRKELRKQRKGGLVKKKKTEQHAPRSPVSKKSHQQTEHSKGGQKKKAEPQKEKEETPEHWEFLPPSSPRSQIPSSPSKTKREASSKEKEKDQTKVQLDSLAEDLEREQAYLRKKLKIATGEMGKKKEKKLARSLQAEFFGGELMDLVTDIMDPSAVPQAELPEPSWKRERLDLMEDGDEDEEEDEDGDGEEEGEEGEGEFEDEEEGEGEDESMGGEAEEEDSEDEEGEEDFMRDLMGGDEDEEDGESDDEEDGEEEEGDDDADEKVSGGAKGSISGVGVGLEGGDGKYVPPHLRRKLLEQQMAASASGSSCSAAEIEKKIKTACAFVQPKLTGLINRLTEGNLEPVSQQLLQLLRKHFGGPSLTDREGEGKGGKEKKKEIERERQQWHNAAADVITQAVCKSSIQNPRSTASLVGTQTASLLMLHTLFDVRIGANFMATLIRTVRTELPAVDALAALEGDESMAAAADELNAEQQGMEDRRLFLRHAILAVAFLFDYQALDPSLVFALFRKLAGEGDGDRPPNAARVDLLLLLLRFAGPRLRSETPTSFRDILNFLLQRAGATAGSGGGGGVKENGEAPKRIQFLIKDLQDLKNNKASSAASDRFAALRRILQQSPVMRGMKPQEFVIGGGGGDASKGLALWSDLESGRVSADALVASLKTAEASGRQMTAQMMSEETENPLFALAAKHRMSSDVQKNIFVALMGSESVDDAVSRVSEAVVAAGKLRAKGGQSSGSSLMPHVAAVALHCALHETAFNEFYCDFAAALCRLPGSAGKKYSRVFRQAVAAQLSRLSDLTTRKVLHLARFLSEMVIEDLIPLSSIRFLDFSSMEGERGLQGRLGLFLRQESAEREERREISVLEGRYFACLSCCLCVRVLSRWLVRFGESMGCA
uniref:MI domain-containing protein n=1 Tax=Chromera velia CCMP2878 TaxID=1169474 RepID=A0A0G4G3F9_9ALVE|eukprot:Cvel_20049.t1-p1 / transcript=Cvel_20049.t1 / gene=Cvel_20049 / organism=Chromera_velia_CCMP2878 / gene_product=Suppressor of glycerol defect protein 1, putative / transcript_product=Suppressor of glycerol defect protein 1, putative / location=Cvel_scaffold1772:19694-25375(-) / protein_length=927 / sequence_SO=supercontig / SO=protein_coding / is_pseudo=false